MCVCVVGDGVDGCVRASGRGVLRYRECGCVIHPPVRRFSRPFMIPAFPALLQFADLHLEMRGGKLGLDFADFDKTTSSTGERGGRAQHIAHSMEEDVA